MIDFYVYVHRRATTGEIFYVGKGHGNRAWSKSGRSKHWHNIVAKDELVVEIVTTGLQEWYAFELETSLIALHGRRDTGHGPLVNNTDGGEGAVGAILSKESRKRLSESKLGKKQAPETVKKRAAANKGKKRTADFCEKMRRQALGNPGRTGMLHLKETKVKMSKALLGNTRNRGKPRTGKAKESLLAGIELRKRAVCNAENVYLTIQDASQNAFISGLAKTAKSASSKISMCCSGARASAYGTTWRYATPEETAALKEKGRPQAPLSDLRSVA
jgi:hypothetical protein